MFSKHYRHREYYLLERKNKTVTFLKITKNEVENSSPLIFCYFNNSGKVTNDILTGITFETNQSALIDENENLKFIGLLDKAPEIFDDELIETSPLFVYPKVEDSF